MANYSIKVGIYKSIKNALVVLAPSIIAFIANLPPDIIATYAVPLGFVTYFIKNFIQVSREKEKK